MLDEKKLYASIGSRIRQVREAQEPRMSQDGLAQALKLKRTSITNIESGKQKLSLETIYLFCERFGLKVSDVLPDIGEVTYAHERSVTVAGESYAVGAKTADLVESLRPIPRPRKDT